jgi:integrase
MQNKNNIEIIHKVSNQLLFEVESKLDLLVEGQETNATNLKDIRDDVQKGFIGLALRNENLLQLNEQLKQQLETVVEELNQIKEERQEKAAQKEARANRKRLPKRDPMTAEIYNELIKEAEGPSYINLRLRLTICLLAVTGVRINELLNIKVSQLKTLTEESWIAISRSKRGPTNHKAFLTKEGKKIIQDRKKDFEFIFLIKEPSACVFTSEVNHYKKYSAKSLIGMSIKSSGRMFNGKSNGFFNTLSGSNTATPKSTVLFTIISYRTASNCDRPS